MRHFPSVSIQRNFSEAMGHNILELNVAVKGQGGPRSPECVEAMAFQWNVIMR